MMFPLTAKQVKLLNMIVNYGCKNYDKVDDEIGFMITFEDFAKEGFYADEKACQTLIAQDLLAVCQHAFVKIIYNGYESYYFAFYSFDMVDDSVFFTIDLEALTHIRDAY